MRKVYRASDTIAPIVADLQGSDEGLGPWVWGLVLIGFGVAMAVPGNPLAADSEYSGTLVVYGFSLALVTTGVAMLSRRIPALAAFGSRHRLAITLIGILALLMTFGTLMFMQEPGPIKILVLIGLAISFAAIPLWLLQRRNARRIAAELSHAVSGLKPVAVEHLASATPASPGELVIALYEVGDLPAALPLRDTVTADCNIVGLPRCRLLYFYNFFADAINTKLRPTAGWRLHGPVAMLASPLDLARAAGYSLHVAESVESRLLTDPSMIDARLAALTDDPLPPQPVPQWKLWRQWTGSAPWARRAWNWWSGELSNPALPELFEDSGAYPEDVLLCTDASWQAGVAALTKRAEKAVMDAADFNPARRGLVWEIQHVLNHFATQDFVVLANSFTDLPALGAEFRRAWRSMAATSPNNRPDEAWLRIVLLTGDDIGGFDDDSARGARDPALRDHERISAHHRIVALLRSA